MDMRIRFMEKIEILAQLDEIQGFYASTSLFHKAFRHLIISN